MRENITQRTIERYSELFDIKRKTYFFIFKESNKHLIKRIVLKANKIKSKYPKYERPSLPNMKNKIPIPKGSERIMITQEMKNQGMKCKGKGFNCYNCKDKKECLDYEYNQQLEKDIKIHDRCIYPVEGLPYKYIILYTISGIDKCFSTVSDKEKLTLTEIYKLIIEHEKSDNIQNCVCSGSHDGRTEKPPKEKCKYCEEGLALINGKHLGLALYNKNHVYIRGYDENGWDISENSTFNYCPKCGRKLNE